MGTKLLVSVVSLLLLVIIFLNAITIKILFDDKRTYTLQAQSTEAMLAGRDFAGVAKRSLDSLRIALGSIDPRRPIAAQPQQVSRFDSVVENQTELGWIAVALADRRTGSLKGLIQHKRNGTRTTAESEAAGELPSATLKEILPDLERSGYALYNASVLGGEPEIGVAVADLQLKTPDGALPIAYGHLGLNGFGGEARSGHLVIANLAGSVLFANDPELTFSRKTVADDPLFEASASAPLSTGTKEYEFEGTRWLGSYVKPGLDFVVLTRTEWWRAMSAAYNLMEKFILLGLMAIGAAVIFAILFSKTMTAPINRLFTATRQVAAGNFDLALKPSSRDEIGALTDSFVSMSHRISSLIQERVKSAHLENELAIASTVQQTLIPPPHFENSRIRIHSHYQPASECGGDWWGFFGVGRKLCLMIADATGHGLPSALITASARSCFSVMHKLAQEMPEFSFAPGSMLAYANRVVHDAASGQIMMTFFAATLDLDEGTLTYASAGHNPPWLFQKSGDGYTQRSLTALGQRLGESRDIAPFEEITIPVQPGDLLFLYTDGLIEGKDQQDEVFGKKRALHSVETHLAAGPEKIISSLMEEFLQFNSGKPLDDDVTIAVAEILKIGPETKA